MENFNEFKIFDPYEYSQREFEPFGEMATIGTLDKPPLRVQINPDDDRIGNPYFKVYDSPIPKARETRVCRLHFLDTGMEYHRDKYVDWIPNSKDIKNIKSFLNMNHQDFIQYTNWQMACWLWNLEYKFFTSKDRDDYINGKFDNKFKDNPSYIPSNVVIPKTWIYDPPKSKHKRR